MVEVVMCTSKRANRPPYQHEVILDAADGLDWETRCKCDPIYAVPRNTLKQKRGRVSPARCAALARTLIAAHGWAAVM
jgi:mRNA-degrading endonuclease toxin of MazEF toxin-antitoxin module